MLCYIKPFDFLVLSLSDNNRVDVIKAFNSASRYLNASLNIDNPYFKQIVGQMYHFKLQLNKANSFDNEAPVWDLDLSITNSKV